MTAALETPVRLTVVLCGVCGNEVVYDNLGDGRAPQHLVKPADGHLIKFGNLERMDIAPVNTLAGLDALEDILDEEEAVYPPWPGPGKPRPADVVEEFPDARSGPRTMLKAAAKAGWEVEKQTMCHGPIPFGNTAGAWRYADSLGVLWSHPDGRKALAFWVAPEDQGFAFDFGLISQSGRGSMSSTDFKECLRSIVAD